MKKEWYTISNVTELDTPALVIYPDRVRKNLEIVKTFVEDVNQLRPHVKTNKCPQVARLMMEAGIRKFKCATIAEAEMLAGEKAQDVLLAYQLQGPKAVRYFELIKKYPATAFSCLIDNETNLRQLAELAQKEKLVARVFIDLNVGMNRTGIAPGKDAATLFELASRTNGIEFVGLHAYDGHLRDTDLQVRKQKCDSAFAPVEVMWRNIRSITGRDPVIVAGGTPTFPVHAKRKGVEASPGTFIFWDKGYQKILHEQPFEFAAIVVTRVISVPSTNTVCLDLGHKSIASENPLENRVYLLNGEGLQPVGHSEEHMVFQVNGENRCQAGDVFYGVPHHICPTVALYDAAAVCLENAVRESWPILSRKRKITV